MATFAEYPDNAGSLRTQYASGTIRRGVKCDVTIVTPSHQSVIDLSLFPIQTRGTSGWSIPITGEASGTDTIECNGVRYLVRNGKWSAVILVDHPGEVRVLAMAVDSSHSISFNCALLSLSSPKPGSIVSLSKEGLRGAVLQLEAKAYGLPANTKLESCAWKIDITGFFKTRKALKARGKRTFSQTYSEPWWQRYHMRYETSQEGAGASFVIPEKVGGWATIEAHGSITRTQSALKSQPIVVDIRGENPSKADIENVLKECAEPKDIELLSKIICAESKFRQFDPLPQKSPAMDKVFSPMQSPRFRPLVGPPAGIGLLQVDPAEFPSEHWDWVMNIKAGVRTFSEKKRAAQKWPEKERKRLEKLRHRAETEIDRNRAARGLGPINLEKVVIPAFSPAQLRREIIRRYNGGNQHRFDLEYRVAGDGLSALIVGARNWAEDPGYWRKGKWVQLSPKRQKYVEKVEGCQNDE